MRKRSESGAIVVEGLVSLSVFIFAIFTILSIVNIYYVQAKMSVALNTAAKEISQYSYLYYKFDLDEIESALNEGASTAEDTVDQTIDGVDSLIDSFSDGTSSMSSLDSDGVMTAIQSGNATIESLSSMYSENIASDPAGFMVSMGKLVGAELTSEAKELLAGFLAKVFMEKNLKDYEGDTVDSFLARYNVVDGVDGLDFNYSTMMQGGDSDKIQLVVTYEVSVIKLLNIDIKLKFRQVALTSAWDNGISSTSSSSESDSDSEN